MHGSKTGADYVGFNSLCTGTNIGEWDSCLIWMGFTGNGLLDRMIMIVDKALN